MGISIQMLGTGYAFSKKYYNTNALIQYGDYRLMIDCGYTATRSLHDLNIKLSQINAVFITHLHADHIGGLEEFAFQMMYVHHTKPVLIIPSVLKDPLWNYSLRGGLENITDNMTCLEDYFHIIEIADGVRTEIAPGFNLETIPTLHIPHKPSYSIYLNDCVYYSADSCFNRALLEQLYKQRGCKTILHDCQLFQPESVHATMGDLLTLPAEMQKITYLMHYGDNKDDFHGKSGQMTFLNQHEIYHF